MFDFDVPISTLILEELDVLSTVMKVSADYGTCLRVIDA